jgi:DNA polymerase-3 subunit alpha
MTALLSSVSGEQDKVQGYIAECQAMGIDVLPPDINISGKDFTADDGSIRFGLSAVKNVGEAAVQHITDVRKAGGKFTSMQDFLSRIDLRLINKRAIEALIKSGAGLGLRISRKQVLENLDNLVDSATRKQSQQAIGQLSLFGAMQTSAPAVALLDADAEEFTETELQRMEHDLLGFYVTSHPLKRVQNRLRFLTTHNLKEVKEVSDGTTVIIGGLAIDISKKLTRQNKLLSIIQLEDLHGKVEVVVYEEVLNKLDPDLLQLQSLLLIKGKAKSGEEDISILANGIRKISDASLVNVYFEEEQNFVILNRLKDIFNSFSGEDPVLLHFPHDSRNQMILTGSQYWVNASTALQNALVKAFDQNIKIQINRVTI